MSPDNRITLSDGTRIGYARYGASDGIPVLYCHGLPGSRREAQVFHRACLDAGVQLIAPDRPGYGLSDPIAGSPLLQWPRVIAELADSLGFERFYMLAMSGGAPYALACASRLAGRVRGTAICGGLGEVSDRALRKGMAVQARLGFWLAERGAGWLRLAYGLVATAAARRIPGVVLAVMIRLNPEPDRAVLREPDVHALYIANLREAFRHGSAGGVADMCAVVRPWPFDPSAVRGLHVWHGRRDGIVPLRHSERLVERVPAAYLMRMDGEGHFSLPVRHAAAVVARLIAAPA